MSEEEAHNLTHTVDTQQYLNAGGKRETSFNRA
jgi:hypothetical protein